MKSKNFNKGFYTKKNFKVQFLQVLCKNNVTEIYNKSIKEIF